MNTAIQPLKENLAIIQKGLAQMSRHRVTALPSHTTWELIDDLEDKADQLMKQLAQIEAEEGRSASGN